MHPRVRSSLVPGGVHLQKAAKRTAARRYKCMEVERVVAEWLVLKCCDSTAVGVERVPLKSSVYMGNGWFSSLRAL